jgi:hypothetical protein
MTERAQKVMEEIQALSPSDQLRLAADLIEEAAKLPNAEARFANLKIARRILERTTLEVGMVVDRLGESAL